MTTRPSRTRARLGYALGVIGLAAGCGLPDLAADQRCRGKCDSLSDEAYADVRRDVDRVLIIPLNREFFFPRNCQRAGASSDCLHTAAWPRDNQSFRLAAREVKRHYEQAFDAEVVIAEGERQDYELPEYERVHFNYPPELDGDPVDPGERVEGLWHWSQFRDLAAELIDEGDRFDRVIFLGHGGWDGPMLTIDQFDSGIEREGSTTRLWKRYERQPGMVVEYTLTYDHERYATFDTQAEELLRQALMPRGSIRRALATVGYGDASLFSRDQRAFDKCLGREAQKGCWRPCQELCEQVRDMLAGGGDGADDEDFEDAIWDRCNDGCKSECVQQVLDDPSQEDIELCDADAKAWWHRLQHKRKETLREEAFIAFAETLNELVKPGGLIFAGHCNAATPIDRQRKKDADEKAVLIKETFGFGRSHRAYIYLLAAATGRHVAGPMDNTTVLEHAPKQIELLEQGIEQQGRRPGQTVFIAAPGEDGGGDLPPRKAYKEADDDDNDAADEASADGDDDRS